MSGHTPGPWIVRESNTQIGRCFRVGTAEVLDCGHGQILLYDDSTLLNPHAEGVQQANARLIATAPELLEALKNAVQWFTEWNVEIGPTEEQLLIGLDAVIGKAEGR